MARQILTRFHPDKKICSSVTKTRLVCGSLYGDRLSNKPLKTVAGAVAGEKRGKHCARQNLINFDNTWTSEFHRGTGRSVFNCLKGFLCPVEVVGKFQGKGRRKEECQWHRLLHVAQFVDHRTSINKFALVWRHRFNMTKLFPSLAKYDKVLSKFGQQYIYVICRLGGPYSEKLWPRTWP